MKGHSAREVKVSFSRRQILVAIFKLQLSLILAFNPLLTYQYWSHTGGSLTESVYTSTGICTLICVYVWVCDRVCVGDCMCYGVCVCTCIHEYGYILGQCKSKCRFCNCFKKQLLLHRLIPVFVCVCILCIVCVQKWICSNAFIEGRYHRC